MKRFRTFSLVIIIVPVILFACMIALNLSLDPDQIFSKGRDYPFFSRGLPFYKNAGVINNYDIKSIGVGGSLMDNIIPSEAEAALGWHDMYSLAMDASDPASVADVTLYALRKHRIGDVLFSLQPEQLAARASSQEGERGVAKNFTFLYDDDRWNDLMVFVQVPTYYIKGFFSARRQREKLNPKNFPGLSEKDILAASRDLYSHYMGYYTHYNRPLFISSLETAEEPAEPLTEQDKKNVRENFERHIRPIVEQNPQTQFYFIVPPSTFLARRLSRNIFSYALKYLADNLLRYPNVRLYGFANDAFNADLRLYADLDHSHIEVSRFVLQAIAHDEHRLTAENVDGYLRRFNDIMNDYKVPPLWQTKYYPLRNGPYPQDGYITYYDAARLVWGDRFSDALNNNIPRSPYLAEKSYVEDTPLKTWPPLDASRDELQAHHAAAARLAKNLAYMPPVPAAAAQP